MDERLWDYIDGLLNTEEKSFIEELIHYRNGFGSADSYDAQASFAQRRRDGGDGVFGRYHYLMIVVSITREGGGLKRWKLH